MTIVFYLSDLHPHMHQVYSIYSIQVLFPPTLVVLHFKYAGAICGGETCQLWAERWVCFIETEEAWIRLPDRPRTSLLIAPSSDAASSSNWQNVGVDGVKMAAVLFTSMTAACQLYGRLSEHGRKRQREWDGGREALSWRGVELDRESFIFCVYWNHSFFLLLLLSRTGNYNIIHQCQYTSGTNLVSVTLYLLIIS